jgi:hypothetical protein
MRPVLQIFPAYVLVSFTCVVRTPWNSLKLEVKKRRLLAGCNGQKRRSVSKA